MTAGGVQWMTAGSGILHQEMPKGDERGRMHGFQLWANLPAALKMNNPRYQDIPSAAIPEVTEDDGTRARIICGTFWGKTGPAEGVAPPIPVTLTSQSRRASAAASRTISHPCPHLLCVSTARSSGPISSATAPTLANEAHSFYP
jgi:redox-sensitive bicupin YhaK (pirin superfamily)